MRKTIPKRKVFYIRFEWRTKNTMSIDCVSAFPTPVLSFTHDYYHKFRDELIAHIYETRDNSDGVLKSNNGGWQSNVMQLPEKFANYIFGNASEVLDLFLASEYTCQIGNLWYNINGPGASNDRHTHPGCDLAGIFFVKVPEGDCGELEIENPNHFAQYHMLSSLDEKLKKDLRASHSMWLPPEEGATVIFPSNILHRVMTNNTDEDRISIAWNMRIVDRP